MPATADHDPDVRNELERRLRTVEDPSYDDPARADLPTLDIVLVLVLVVVVCVVSFAWGY